MITVLFLSLTLQLSAETGGSNPVIVEKTTASLVEKTPVYQQKMADGMPQTPIRRFQDANLKGCENRFYFNYGSDLSNMATDHYWSQAHAMDVMIGAHMYTESKQYLDIYPLWWEGALKFNFVGREEDPWWNVFVDDMEWIVLTRIRMFESTKNTKCLKRARRTCDDWVWSIWGPEDEAPWSGGITWKTNVAKSKNACPNGPAALIATRLCNFRGTMGKKAGKPKQAYLNEAIKIYTWEKNNLLDHQTRAVYDNMNGEGKITRQVLSYNSDIFLGAARELYKTTGDKQYLTDAVKAANFVINHLSMNEGAFSDAEGGDGGLFHGIFFRYFVKLTNSPVLDSANHNKLRDHITHCAAVMTEQGVNRKTMLYSGCWRKASIDDESVGLTPHLIGCMLMEAMCVLKHRQSEREER